MQSAKIRNFDGILTRNRSFLPANGSMSNNAEIRGQFADSSGEIAD
jgi:hypothetical protein